MERWIVRYSDIVSPMRMNRELNRILHSIVTLVTIGAIGAFSISSCKKDVATPPPSDTGPHKQFSWSTDTISFPGSVQTSMQSIYGTGADNIYIVGHNEVKAGRIFHYNGTAWDPVGLDHLAGEFSAIGGSSSTDIWIAGAELYYDPITRILLDSSMIVHYDGSNWNKSSIPKGTGLNCISVLSRSHILAGSRTGSIFRFDGTQWTKYDLGENLFISSIVCMSPSTGYCIANQEDWSPPNDSLAYFLYEYSGSGWSVIDSVSLTPGAPPPRFGNKLTVCNGELYSGGPNIYRYSHSTWESVFSGNVAQFWKGPDNDMVVAGDGVYYFNGTIWNQVAQTQPMYALGIYASADDLFIVGNDNWKSIVIHGKK
jgi:hypothetical protein